MPWYPDRRQRYTHSAPWEHTPGTPNAANTTKSEAKTTLATRQSDTYEQNEKGEHVLVKGNMSAGTAFRKTTASKLAQSHLEQPPSLPNLAYGHNESLMKSPDGLVPVSPVPDLSPSESSETLTRALMSGDAPSSGAPSPVPYNGQSTD